MSIVMWALTVLSLALGAGQPGYPCEEDQLLMARPPAACVTIDDLVLGAGQ